MASMTRSGLLFGVLSAIAGFAVAVADAVPCVPVDYNPEADVLAAPPQLLACNDTANQALFEDTPATNEGMARYNWHGQTFKAAAACFRSTLTGADAVKIETRRRRLPTKPVIILYSSDHFSRRRLDALFTATCLDSHVSLVCFAIP